LYTSTSASRTLSITGFGVPFGACRRQPELDLVEIRDTGLTAGRTLGSVGSRSDIAISAPTRFESMYGCSRPCRSDREVDPVREQLGHDRADPR
jgi:hypothetical protein